MKCINIKLIIIALITTYSVNSNAALLEEGSTIPVKLSQNVNANMDLTGMTVYFSVIEDIYVEDEIVIKEGEFVKGFILEAVGRKSLGKGGKLTLAPKSMKTSNKQLIRFEQNPLSSEGRKRTGATVAHVVMWGPLGLFAKGRAAFIMRNTEFDLTVEKDVDLKPYNAKEAKELDRTIVNGDFKKYSSKINFRKGKTGKDFVFYISADEINNSNLNSRDVKIYSVNSDVLPKPVKAKFITLNSKENRYEVVFDFSKVVSYINPGSADVEIHIGDSMKVETSLVTKWKIK